MKVALSEKKNEGGDNMLTKKKCSNIRWVLSV